MEKIDERVLQRGGGSAYSISLPKVYIADLQLEPGTIMEIHREGDLLMIRPTTRKKDGPKQP